MGFGFIFRYLSFLIIELIHPGRALLELIPHGVFIAYWDWSWDELASYNLPAFVQYVYNYTGQRMHYVGHSLGTLMALAAFSQGQLQTMLRSAALLSPIAHLNQITSQPTKVAADIFIAMRYMWCQLWDLFLLLLLACWILHVCKYLLSAFSTLPDQNHDRCCYTVYKPE